MSITILTKTLTPPPIDQKEILRYAGVKSADENTLSLLAECLLEIEDKLSYKVCYCELKVEIINDLCDFEILKTKSKNLCENLKDCKKVLLLAATIGALFDRLITKYSLLSPAKALMFQAIGAERIEALCDAFSNDYISENDVLLKPRFSAGYGDLALDIQKDIFRILNCSKNIGLSLCDSLLMLPTKSVTAFIGIIDNGYS